MAKTTTNILNNVTIAAGYTYGAHPRKTDISSVTSLYLSFESTATNGATPPTKGNHIKVHYVFSNTSLADPATAVTVVKPANYFSIVFDNTANGVDITNTPSIVFTGNYLYTWVESVALSQPVTLKLDVLYN